MAVGASTSYCNYCNDEADITCFQFLQSDGLGRERAELFDFINVVVGAEPNLHVIGDAAFHHANENDSAPIGIKPGIED